ncbi:MAG TPA: L,D-transpeptidase [Verrucomicrobiae bacterium]|nr:L,D-transpeptidase [Verrucomicrobiae bacterium]
MPKPRRAKRPFVVGLVTLAAGAGLLVWLVTSPGDTNLSPPLSPSRAAKSSRVEQPGSKKTPDRLSTDSTARGTKPAAATPGVVASSTSASEQPVPTAVPSRQPSKDSNPLPRPATNAFEAQLALTRLGISPGSIDGVFGSRTRSALVAFQRKTGLPLTSDLDAATRRRLLIAEPSYTNYVVTVEDLKRLRPLGKTWLEKSQQDRLDYETLLELVSEAGRSSPALIQRLNPAIPWTNVTAGTVVQIPNVGQPAVGGRAAFARIHLENRTLQAFDENTNLVAHFPCSIAAFAEKRPAGELHVSVIAPNPNYTFDPENFPESPEARELNRKLVLQPGPNNPVGTVWIGLDRPGYGIHGTPRPEQVGRAESHGCFRLTNWNAEHFLQLVWVGMAVYVEP